MKQYDDKVTRSAVSMNRLMRKKGLASDIVLGRAPNKSDAWIASGLKFLSVLLAQLGKTLLSTVLVHLAETVKPGSAKELPSPEQEKNKQKLYGENSSYTPYAYANDYRRPTETFPGFER